MITGRKYSSIRKDIITLRILSAVISVMLHPLIMVTILFSVITYNVPELFETISDQGKRSLIKLVFITTYLLPLIIFILNIIIVERKFSMSRLYMENKNERILPFFYIGIFYAGITYLLYTYLHMNMLLVLMMASISLCVLLVAVISIFWKISAHATGIAGVIVCLIFTQYLYSDARMFWPLIALIFLGGLLLSARLYLRAHTPEQVLAGVLMAVAVCGSTLIFM